jgi:hypothetical protein
MAISMLYLGIIRERESYEKFEIYTKQRLWNIVIVI